MSKNKISVAFFPSSVMNYGNPYWSLLASALEKDGLFIQCDIPKTFSKKWLLDNKNHVHILHIHYCQHFYKSHGRVNFKKLVKLPFLMLLARMIGYRLIYTLHNLTPTYPLEPRWLDMVGHFCVIHLSERVIVHCKQAKSLLAKKYWRFWKIFVVDHPNYLDIYSNSLTNEKAKKKLGIEKNKVVFTYFGGIRPNKGIETLIDAFKRLNGKNYRLVIAGEPQVSEYTEKIKNQILNDPRIYCFFHFIHNDDIQIYLNSADIIVLPFERILTSSSTILAMSFKKPVIVPRMGCLPELIEPDAGWLYEPGNVNSLLKVMVKASKSDFESVGECSLKRVLPYTFERFAKQTIDIYSK